MKKVLVILYYWPPAGGSAVQRWLKFSKYLPGYGWEPVIYAPENAQYPEIDENLQREVPAGLEILRQPIREPHHLYKKFIGLKKQDAIGAAMTLKSQPGAMASKKAKFAWWIRSNIFIPDARFLWIRPSVRFLRKYLENNRPDAIITTGPPHSLHMIGYHLRKAFDIPWVADFRDPWTSIDYYADLNLSRWADRKHHLLESRVLLTADHVIAVGPNMEEEFRRIGAGNVTVITNGYDETDFANGAAEHDPEFSLIHLGTLSAARNCPALWKALKAKADEDPQFASDLKIRLIGHVDFTVLNDLEAHGLQGFLWRTDYISHREGMKILKQSAVLVLFINQSLNARGVITGKLFEYLASGRPILLLGPPDGDAALILRETGGGLAADFNDTSVIREQLDHYYRQYRSGNLQVHSSKVDRYTRKALAGKLAGLLDQITESGHNLNRPV